MSSRHGFPLPALLAISLVASEEDIQFSCPWCSTRLSLPRKDFDSERAVLCPRCNQPIDMEIQRRLVRHEAKAPQGGPSRREVTLPRSRQAPEPNLLQTPVPPSPPEAEPRDWSKPIDVDAAFGKSGTPRDEAFRQMPGASSQRPVESETGPAPAKVRCPSCDFENSLGYDPLRSGPPKCAWCGTLLPQ